MSVKVNAAQSGYDAKVNETAKTNQTETEQTTASVGVDTNDTYEKTTPEKDTTYKPDFKKMKMMKADFGRQVAAFNKMVETLFTQQAGASQGATFDLLSAMEQGDLKAQLEGLTVDEATRAKAEEMISDDGYWGVEQTAGRIVDFAKALTGGDPSKIDTMISAIEDGFKQAEELWGDKLPDISQKTKDRAMELLEEWRNESGGTTQS